jgi:hypothetical protein
MLDLFNGLPDVSVRIKSVKKVGICTIILIINPKRVQAFLKKWWVESDFKAPNLPLIMHDNI